MSDQDRTHYYVPAPLDTSSTTLPTALEPLEETLAAHVHAVWARERLRQGWRYGPERDDATRTHPCLVPFEALPEAEKAYDRATAQETLKAIVAAGWTLVPPGEG